jgi:arginase
MATILVPYHQDERLAEGNIPVSADNAVDAELPDGDRWRRLTHLCDSTGAHFELYAGPIGLRPVPAERTVLAGARDLDPAEVDYLSGAALRLVQVSEVGAGTVPHGPIVVHVDLDVIDADELPGLRFPARGGPSADSVLTALADLLATGRVAALSVACPWWPAVDEEESGIRRQLLSRLRSLVGA